ncbi:MAG TPA: hypothetical protein P5305_11040 [Rubrivivax sp.]|nr:hypothetical protein [Rubrivivax sp.]HRY88413.1 hypothetical protein [Rubrivivax sp.]
MTIPQLPSTGEGRTRWTKIAAGVWLALVSVLAIVNSVALSRLAEQDRSSAQDTHVQALVARVSDLERQAEAAARQPKAITQADFEAARQALDARLAQVEQAQATQTPTGDLDSLRSRLGDIEQRLKKAAAPTTGPRRAPEPAPPKVPEPPFKVLGVELRGGQRFLSVSAPNALSVLDVWLLREGDAAGAWVLQTIEPRAAVFRVDGQTQRIALP